MKIDLRDKVTVLCARRGAGKTVMAQHLIKNSKHQFKDVFIISPSSFSGTWKGIVPDENVHETYSDDWVNKLIERMTHANRGKTQKSPDFKRVLLVLDDVLNDIKAHQMKTFRVIPGRGRHVGIALMCVCQHFRSSLPPIARNNADYVFYGKNNQQSTDLLWEEFGIGLKKDQFMKMVEKSTEDHRFLVIDNTAGSVDNPHVVYGSMKVPLEK